MWLHAKMPAVCIAPAADVWSYGATLHEAATGQHLFAGSSERSVHAGVRQWCAARAGQADLAPWERAVRASGNVAALVWMCCAPSVAQRFQLPDPTQHSATLRRLWGRVAFARRHE